MEFLLEGWDVRTVRETLPTLLRGLAILKEHPMNGPKVEECLRELVAPEEEPATWHLRLSRAV